MNQTSIVSIVSGRNWNRSLLLIVLVLFASNLFVQSAAAQSYISAEPIPSGDVIGSGNLTKILDLGYSRLERWSSLLLNQCRIGDKVAQVLSSNGATRSITADNLRITVAAGGFEAVTDPTYVATIKDSGAKGASDEDIATLDNALGYVLNQGGTVHFSLTRPHAYDFPLDYAVVSFDGDLRGLRAKAFFDHLGTVDPALWSGPYAGFTQVEDSMVFLQPDTTKREFVAGLSAAAGTFPGAEYETLNRNGKPTTATAGVSFPGNDWIAFPNGDQYLANIANASPRLLSQLAALRQQHLQAVADLLSAIDHGKVNTYLNDQFRCPR